MKALPFSLLLQNRVVGCLTCLFLFVLWPSACDAAPVMGTNEDFSMVSRAVVELLQTRDPVHFAGQLAPTLEDYRAILSTNLPTTGEDPLKDFQNRAQHQRQQLEASAGVFLARAESLHLDFSNVTFHTRIIPPKYLGSIRFGEAQPENLLIPWAEKIEVVLVPDSGTQNASGGEYRVTVRGLMKVRGGWRCLQGVQWVEFPVGLADEKTTRELALLNKVTTYQGFTGQDDPALLKLGATLVRFLRERDLAIYEKDVLINSDLIWAQFQKRGGNGPSRQEIDQEVDARVREQVEIAGAMLKQMDAASIDLKSADVQIKEATLEHAQPQGAPGSLDGLIGEQFKLTLTVKTDGKAKNGTPLSGDYVLAANELTRFGDDWRVVNDLRWYQLPAGVVDKQTVEAMKFEDYVAEHRTLPLGMAVPEIEFTSLDGEKKMKLSDLRGKVVVLDFWATWCGPCQEPMAKLQTLWQEHPDWKDRVAIVPLSIDDTIDIVRKHVDQRGWTNTFNVWAGDGGWQSAPAKTFRVTSVPTTYIINDQGKIIKAGHPAAMDIGSDVDAQLKLAEK